MKFIAFALIPLLIFPNVGEAATPSPTTTKKVSSASPSAKPTSSSTKSPVAKKVTKKPVYKRVVRKKVKPLKSPSPQWPPANFKSSGSIYAKVPTAKELEGYASNSSYLTMGLSYCQTYACGSVFLASETGCNWWQVDAMVNAPSKDNPNNRETVGTIRTLESGSKPKKIVAVLLKSNLLIEDGVTVGGITARCWSTEKPANIPSNTYTPFGSATATPTN